MPISTSRTSSSSKKSRFEIPPTLTALVTRLITSRLMLSLCNCNHISVSLSRLARLRPNMEQEKTKNGMKIYSDLVLETSVACPQTSSTIFRFVSYQFEKSFAFSEQSQKFSARGKSCSFSNLRSVQDASLQCSDGLKSTRKTFLVI